mmetsp:Transcript_19408/g.39075  ORF Transcript_19408/g.39075 Transcript_19408/m.39075 type:complete len:137 (-) Transcript_19408:73-483(-)
METSPNAKLLGELQGLLTDIVREATVPASVLLCSVLGAYFVAHVVAKCCLRRSQGECLGCKRNPWNNTNWRERLFKAMKKASALQPSRPKEEKTTQRPPPATLRWMAREKAEKERTAAAASRKSEQPCLQTVAEPT